MREVFEKRIGPAVLLPEAFGGFGLLTEDIRYVSLRAKILIIISQLLKWLSSFIPSLIRIADSVYVVASKRQEQAATGLTRK
jgi:hypothetical protein